MLCYTLVVTVLLSSTSSPSPSPPSTSATVPPSTAVPGAHQDAADFYGIFGAVAIIVVAIVVIRLAFRRPKLKGPPPRRGP